MKIKDKELKNINDLINEKLTITNELKYLLNNKEIERLNNNEILNFSKNILNLCLDLNRNFKVDGKVLWGLEIDCNELSSLIESYTYINIRKIKDHLENFEFDKIDEYFSISKKLKFKEIKEYLKYMDFNEWINEIETYEKYLKNFS
jgi:hypothetical protein